MRALNWSTFSSPNGALSRSPIIVVRLIYDAETISFTSTPETLSNLSGTVIPGSVVGLSAVSQQVFPLEGRAQIGQVTIGILDDASPTRFTDEVREKLSPTGSPTPIGESLRDRQVQVYIGFGLDFDNYEQFYSPRVNRCVLDRGKYILTCGDVTRQLRQSIFARKKCRLATTITSGSMTFEVNDSDEFEMLEHTAAFTDAPSATVGYLKVEDTGEIVRYTANDTGTDEFTIDERGAFGTVAQAVTVSGSDEDDWPLLTEFIYLEMPCPQLIYALMTGYILGSGSPGITLPSHWHTGISLADVNASEFTNIGADLYENDTSGFMVRFTHRRKTDGKKFIEKQCHRLQRTFSPVRDDGRLGLQRINESLSEAAPVLSVFPNYITRYGNLQHEQSKVVNYYRINWNFDGEEYTRTEDFIDSDSILAHGFTATKEMSFEGFHDTQYTVEKLSQLIQTYRDRFRHPPQTLRINVIPLLVALEANDIINVNLEHLEDYAGSGTLDRPFEIQKVTTNWITGQVSLDLFGSSGEALPPPPLSEGGVLHDDFYSSQGTELSTEVTIVADHMTVDGSISGISLLTHPSAIFYYLGDLTIDSGVTLTIDSNVQLRVLGTLTVNGKIDGNEGGLSGGTPHTNSTINMPDNGHDGSDGYVGQTHSSSGIIFGARQPIVGRHAFHWPGNQTETASHPSFPTLSLDAGDQTSSPPQNYVAGIPSDLRGCGGAAGRPTAWTDGAAGPTFTGSVTKAGQGGTGGPGGAGLVIICRGLVFGLSGEICLNGGDGTNGGSGTVTFVAANGNASISTRGGTGAAGGQGCLLVLLDGGDVPLPDLGGHFEAITGECVPSGNLADNESSGSIYWPDQNSPFAGFNEGWPSAPVNIVHLEDRSSISNRIQYIPG